MTSPPAGLLVAVCAVAAVLLIVLLWVERLVAAGILMGVEALPEPLCCVVVVTAVVVCRIC